MNNIRAGYKVNELGEIPNDWDVNSLEEISRITRLAGAEYSDIWETDDEGTIIALRGYNIGQNKLILNDIETISESMSNRLIRSKLFKGDIVFPCVGTIGKATVISEDNKYHINQNIAKITSNDNINSIYISYFLMSDFTQKQIFKYNTSSSQPNVLVGNLRRFIVNIPPLKEQEKIATILSTVDEQIDNVDVLIEKNKELKKGLMQKLLTKGIGHTEFKKTEIGEIPVEWKIKKLEEVFLILDNLRKPIKASDREYIKGNIPYYGASGIIDWVNDYIFDEELILLGEDGENLNSRNSDLAFKIIGKAWINNHAHVFKVINNDECNIDFMVYYLEAKDYSIYIAGSAQPKITQAQCRKFLLPVPNKEEQDKVASILLSVDKKIEEYENRKIKLEVTKKGLMQQLLTGKIRVSY